MSEAPGLISFDEWSKLSAENRHRYNLLVTEIQSLQAENHQLNVELERRRSELVVMTTERLLPLEQEVRRLKARLVEQGNLTSELRAAVGEVVQYIKAKTVSGYSQCLLCGTLWMDASAEHHLTGCWVPKTLDLLKRSGEK